MTAATLTTKGRLTIPVDVRADLKLKAGDRVEFIPVAPGRYELVAEVAVREVAALKGMFGPAKKAVSIDEMNARVAWVSET